MIYRTLVSGSELEAMITADSVATFDCQFDLADPDAGRAAYLRGHVPGATYLHLNADLSAPPSGSNGRHPLPEPRVFAAKLRAAGVRATQQVVVYDAVGGAVAARAWWLLRWMGHEAVAVLDGGLPAWRAAGRPIETGELVVTTPGDFQPTSSDPGAIVTTAEVLAAVHNRGAASY